MGEDIFCQAIRGESFPGAKTSSDFIPSVTAMSRAKQVKYIPNIEYMYTADRSDSLQNSQKAQDIADSVHVHVQFEELLEQRYPSLLAAAQLDLLLARVQACIHICKSVNIPTSQKKGLYHKYAHGMMHDFRIGVGQQPPCEGEDFVHYHSKWLLPHYVDFRIENQAGRLAPEVRHQ